MNCRGIKVLLFGQRDVGTSVIRCRLEQRGCSCRFALSPEEGSALFERHLFPLILCQGPVCKANAMIGLLGAARCSVYCAYPLEDSCLWLPLMDHGEKCLGAAALWPREFARLLDNLITKLESMQSAAPQRMPAANREPVAIPVPAQVRSVSAGGNSIGA